MAETVKKAKAPAKPRTAKANKEAATPKATTSKTGAKGATQSPTPISEKAVTRMPTHEEIAHLARKYWAERGHADGQAEQDWLRAEQELMQKAS